MTIIGTLTVEGLIGTGIVIAICVALWIILGGIFKKWAKKEEEQKSSKMTAPVMWSVLRFVIVLAGVLAILEINGFDVTGAIAGLGIASAVVGLALQDFLKDVIMGVHIVSDGFFKIGDAVFYNGELGVIDDFNLKTTKIRVIDPPGYVSVCNRKIEEIKLATESTIIDVPVSHTVNTKLADAVFERACDRISKEDGIHNCVYAGMNELGESAIMFRVFIYCSPDNKYPMKRKAIRIIKDDLDAAGIEIPYNQLDVHFDSKEIANKEEIFQ